ncbi:hypothetical protein [Psychrobacillus sp. BL-248-WT-3]|uniref:hypothetical protein n=1 Tax=Psychrobacillus sp. BL-248-WT-3 TaxID=2725306 RepID=UPI00146A28DF|nr:hypothetical protein [Psychrobacillus sp. BL-248-WT-3]NME04729.1 hypothetical protein [Psychrobacillus sp. BL-248-WT-3]
MKDPTYQKVVYGIVMAIAVIIVHFLNVRVYPLQPIFSILIAILIIYVGITVVKKSGKFEQTISRMKYNLLNLVVVFILFIAYFTIDPS